MSEKPEEFRSEQTQREERRLRVPLLIFSVLVGVAIVVGIAMLYMHMLDQPAPGLP